MSAVFKWVAGAAAALAITGGLIFGGFAVYKTLAPATEQVRQADPNGLFSPTSADGTWILMADPNGGTAVKPVYVEPRIIVSPFKLPTE